jgi:OFA family oxalate/formate antiporter-like MFS transporter
MNKPLNRWWIASAGTGIQICLGSVYAWSYFQLLLVRQFGWTQSQVAWAFSTAICFLGLAAAAGGALLPRKGPRVLAVTGGILFGLGYLLAAWALRAESLFGLYLGYGVIGGIGLGLGYVTPVATVAKWFPDKKGLATGMVILGFGMGALVMSKVLAPALMAWSGGNTASVFAGLGGVFIVIVPLLGLLMRNPPGAVAPKAASAAPGRPAWFGGAFILMWLVFFFNILAGIAIIPFQSPLLQELIKARGQTTLEAAAAAGATLIAVSSLFNGAGRMLWGWVSDHLGRAMTFRLLLGTQVLAFAVLTQASHPWLFGALVCYILLCYGGGFGTMPSFVHDRFGGDVMPAAYGAMLTAWSAAGIAGPQLVAYLKDHWPQEASVWAFTATAGILLLGTLISLALRDKPEPAAVSVEPVLAPSPVSAERNSG